MDNLRVLIADDHKLIRRGVRDLLAVRPGWQIFEACDGHEAVRKTTELKPDVAVLDFSMPGLEGPAAASQIAQLCPETSVIVLTMHDSDQVVRDVLGSGAKGFVLKTDADRDLIEAIDAVCQGRHYFTPRVAEMVLKGFLVPGTGGVHQDGGGRLTLRERGVLRMLADGFTSKQIALELKISVRTVETHRIHINRKLGFTSIADLVRYAIRNGMTTRN